MTTESILHHANSQTSSQNNHEHRVFITTTRVHRDSVIVDEPYLTETAKNETYVPNYQSHYELGDDEYFVAGDNRGHSCDSRYFGVVSYSEITGTINQNTQSTTSMLLHILKYAIGIIVLYLLVEKILTVVLCKVFKV